MTFTTEMLIAAGSERFDAAAFPDRFTSGGVDLELGYVFDPGRRDDGVTVTIPLAVLARVDPAAFERQIPGLRADLAVALIRSLPKTLRRNFVPVPDFAKAALARIDQLGDGAARPRLAARRACRGAHRAHRNRHQANRFRSAEGARPSADELLGGRRTGPRGGRRQGSDAPCRPACAATPGRPSPRRRAPWSEPGLTAFPADGIARTVTSSVGGHQVTGYPALVDEGATVGLQVFTSAVDQRRT